MRGEFQDAQDSFFTANPVAAVAGKSHVVTTIVVTVTVAGTITLLGVALGSFPVGRYNLRFPGGVVITDPGLSAAIGGTATFSASLGGYSVSA